VKRLLVLIGLLQTASWTVPQSRGGPLQDQVSLIDALRSRNVMVFSLDRQAMDPCIGNPKDARSAEEFRGICRMSS
jgi:hypothetical protein